LRSLVLVVCVACVSLWGALTANAASPVARFSGVHLGLDTAYGFGATGDWCFCTFLPVTVDAAGGSGGILVGGEAGFDQRWGPFVAGIDAQVSYSSIGFAQRCTTTLQCDGELSWVGAADASLGFVVFDDILVAGSIGYVTGSVRERVIDGATVLDEETSRHDGYVYGARVEQGMSGGWRFGLEYRYYAMSGDADLRAGAGAPTPLDVDWHAHAVGLIIRYELH
jgi:opacity protein-like surface antigen